MRSSLTSFCNWIEIHLICAVIILKVTVIWSWWANQWETKKEKKNYFVDQCYTTEETKGKLTSLSVKRQMLKILSMSVQSAVAKDDPLKFTF